MQQEWQSSKKTNTTTVRARAYAEATKRKKKVTVDTSTMETVGRRNPESQTLDKSYNNIQLRDHAFGNASEHYLIKK